MDSVKSVVTELKNPTSLAEVLMFIGAVNWLFVAVRMRKEPEAQNDLLLATSQSKIGRKIPRMAGLTTVQQLVYTAVGVAGIYHVFHKRDAIFLTVKGSKN